MQIIFSPSKGQQLHYAEQCTSSQPRLLEKSAELRTLLQNMSCDELAKLMKLSDKLAQQTYTRIQQLEQQHTPANSGQALFTFQGDAYSSLQPETYNQEQLDYAQRSLTILSGYYGALRPLDLMQPYRLEMALTLQVSGHNNLTAFWKEPITELLNQALADDTEQILINLASLEYSKAVDSRSSLAGRIVDVVFKQKKAEGTGKGEYKIVAIHAKRARGLMLHWLITERIERAEELHRFALDGYRFDASGQHGTTTDRWVFVKD